MTFEDEEEFYPDNRPGLMVKDMNMKNNRHGLMVEDMKMMEEDWTFFLFYPSSFATHRDIGKMLMACEKIGLNIIGMRLMCATRKFLTAHFGRDGRNPCPGESLPLHLTPYPFIAMALEGDDAINKALQLTSETSVTKPLPFWDDLNILCNRFKLQAYSSCSCISALEDYELWFGIDTHNWKKEVKASIWHVHYLMTLFLAQQNFVDNFYQEDLTFVLIRPLAFQKRCVGELVSIIERNSLYTKGLKLVRKSEVLHSEAWLPNCCSSSEINEDEYAIAMLVRYITPDPERIRIVHNGDGRICTDNDTEKIEICSNLIYLGKLGDKGIIGDFFKFGAVSWVDLTSGSNCGGYFAATLSSLQF
ncbi:hypothetical protein MKW98_006353 [Papaver atlanticum]|uniref:Nucleoside-diphosphate kinase n=1 Tax=Papaver atlanticum TaxID=357466 RepID=A0AAD4RVC7_9MAGN|nr:hypothetical protein MKW98_006353 [Papaver atlanticum]